MTHIDQTVAATANQITLIEDLDHTITALADLSIDLFAKDAETLIASVDEHYRDDDYAGEMVAQNLEHLAKLIRALRPWSPPMLTKEGEAAQ